jgi:hypothetical protein
VFDTWEAEPFASLLVDLLFALDDHHFTHIGELEVNSE